MALSARRTVAALLFVLTTTGAACATGRATATDDRYGVSFVLSAEDTAVAAWNRGDLDAHVSIYADTGTGGPPIRPGGRSRARLSLAPLFADPRPTLRVDSLTVSPLGRDYVLASGKWLLSGAGSTRSGWFTHVWARLPVGWRIVYEHST